MCYNNAMKKGQTPKRMYLKMTPQAARALFVLAQSQSGEMTDPRKVGWALVEEGLLARGLIEKMTLQIASHTGEQERSISSSAGLPTTPRPRKEVEQ